MIKWLSHTAGLEISVRAPKTACAFFNRAAGTAYATLGQILNRMY